MNAGGLATRIPVRLRPDSSRVITRLFVPGHAQTAGQERVSKVVEHVMALDASQVTASLASLTARFEHRHRHLTETFLRHADLIADRVVIGAVISAERRLLLGATFTHEYSVEAAAVCNPSMVALPDQHGVAAGAMRFAISVRQIGEGHCSSIGFRTGEVDNAGNVSVDPIPSFATTGQVGSSEVEGAALRWLTEGVPDDTESITWLLDRLGERFTVTELERRLSELERQGDTRRHAGETVARLRQFAARTYTTEFAAATDLAERVLHPAMPVEANGMEDARFVRFVEGDATVTYHATYTAYDGSAINQQLLTTGDFISFKASPLLGPATANKGMALFPRRINGRYAALSRHDGATNAIAFSDEIGHWPTVTPLECPVAPWEIVQIGNCGPPIETERGWVVLTHGVGPMRTYSIGAWLLDTEDPTKVIGWTSQPLLAAQADEQDGYVPNVLYSCGSMAHGDHLVIPYGIGDAGIGFATVPLVELVDELLAKSGQR